MARDAQRPKILRGGCTTVGPCSDVVDLEYDPAGIVKAAVLAAPTVAAEHLWAEPTDLPVVGDPAAEV